MVASKFDLERKELIEKLKSLGIRNEAILNAIDKVRRELFVNEEFKQLAYNNTALPIDANQTISQPFTIAFMNELLLIEKGNRILEIGTGSGYQAALLCELGAYVYSVERITELYIKAKNLLNKLGYDVKLKCDDGSEGWVEYSPFDKIIVTAGSPVIPKPLLNQLKNKGRLVIPVGDRYSQRVVLVEKIITPDKTVKYIKKEFEDFRFVPLVWKDGWEKDEF